MEQKLPADWKAIIDAFKDTGIYSAEQNVRNAVERCFAIHSKPPKELTDAEIGLVHLEWLDSSNKCDGPTKLMKMAIAAHIRKQSEPERVKFRAARNKITNRVLMFGVADDPTGALGTDWEWLEPEQSFEVVLP